MNDICKGVCLRVNYGLKYPVSRRASSAFKRYYGPVTKEYCDDFCWDFRQQIWIIKLIKIFEFNSMCLLVFINGMYKVLFERYEDQKLDHSINIKKCHKKMKQINF